MSERREPDEALDQQLSALLDGELDPARERELRELAARSPEVGERLEALRRVDAALRGIPEPAVPRDLLARVRARAEGTAQAGRRAPRRRLRWLAAAGAAAAAAAGAWALWLAGGVEPLPQREAPAKTVWAPAPEELALEQLSDEEIELAMELANLEELETLEELELLEALELLEDLEQLERQGRG